MSEACAVNPEIHDLYDYERLAAAAVPGLEEADEQVLAKLALAAEANAGTDDLQLALDCAYINGPTATHQVLEQDNLRREQRTALEIALEVAASNLTLRVGVSPTNPNTIKPSPEMLAILKRDEEFLERLHAWYAEPSDRHVYRSMQSRLFGVIASTLVQQRHPG